MIKDALFSLLDRSTFVSTLLFVFLLVQCTSTKQSAPAQQQLLNHIQVIGSHNSYKQAIQPELLKFAISQDPEVAGLAYSHLPITDQLNLGLRIVEIDIYHDPKGGRYSEPLGNKLLQMQGVDVLSYNDHLELEQPGFKVFHVQDIDFRSHCLRLRDCLSEIKQWSDSNPHHIPLIITLNTKTDKLNLPGSTHPLPFTEEVFDELDQLFAEILGIENILTPASIQKNHNTLNQAILQSGWPSMNSSRGKFLLVLDEPMAKVNTYLSKSRSQIGIMFTNAPAGHEASAFLVLNDPIKDEYVIKEHVGQGYLVRTRADADTREAVENDYSRFEAAKRSGAQYISSDYYYKTEEQPNFKIQFDDGTFTRCNPLFSNIPCNL